MRFGTTTLGILMLAASARAADQTSFKFDFGSGAVAPGYTQVKADAIFSPERGWGFEQRNGTITESQANTTDPLTTDSISSDQPLSFSVVVPEGNYRVTVTLGDPSAEATTTVKAETRRLMLEPIHTAAGKFEKRTFVVNTRQGTIAGSNDKVQLDPREWPTYWTWDNKLTITFIGEHPSIAAMEITRADDARTIFLMGDSTVTDQMSGGFGTWGMNLPRWFDDKVAIANFAESGETIKAFRHENRWAKILSMVKPGDYIFMQFGHNDLNKTGTNAMWPATDFSGLWSNTYSEPHTDYKDGLKKYCEEAKAKGAIPVIVSPMTKVQTTADGGTPSNGLGDYPKCAVEAAQEAQVDCIDLNAMSIDMHNALGPQNSRRAVMDGNHSNVYGGYVLARCVVEGIKHNLPDLAKDLAANIEPFDPKHPAPLPDDFKLPTDPGQPGIPSFGGGRGPRGARGATSGPTTRGR